MASRPAIEEADQALVERSRRDLQLAWGRLCASLEGRVLIIEACVVVVLTGASTEKLRKDAAGAANELATMFGRSVSGHTGSGDSFCSGCRVQR